MGFEEEVKAELWWWTAWGRLSDAYGQWCRPWVAATFVARLDLYQHWESKMEDLGKHDDVFDVEDKDQSRRGVWIQFFFCLNMWICKSLLAEISGLCGLAIPTSRSRVNCEGSCLPFCLHGMSRGSLLICPVGLGVTRPALEDIVRSILGLSTYPT